MYLTDLTNCSLNKENLIFLGSFRQRRTSHRLAMLMQLVRRVVWRSGANKENLIFLGSSMVERSAVKKGMNLNG